MTKRVPRKSAGISRVGPGPDFSLPLPPEAGTLRKTVLDKLLDAEFVTLTYPPATKPEARKFLALVWLQHNGWGLSWSGVGSDSHGRSIYEIRLTNLSDEMRKYACY